MIVDETPAVPWNPRRSDDPFHRIQMQAEKRAKSNGASDADAERCGRAAMALFKMLKESEQEPNTEHILSSVAGDFRRG